MTNYININFDLYININDLNKLDKGEEVTGYKTVSNPDNYELLPYYAFLPSIQINENEYSVCTINK